MAGHVLARLHGHGKIVLPFPGYRIEREAGQLVLRVEREGRSGTVDVASPSGDLCDVETGTLTGPWRVETRLYRCAWPEGFALAADPTDRSPFLLLGPDGSMIWIDGPVDASRATPIEKLAAPGQTVRAVAEAADAARIDLDYVDEGVRFWQRRYVLPWSDDRALVPCAQARAENEKLVSAALDLVEQTLEPVEAT